MVPTAGELRQVDRETGVLTDEKFVFNISDDASMNQAHYEALGEVLNEEVYALLLKEGLHKIRVPSELPEEQATFVFSTRHDFRNSTKVLLIVHGSGVVRAGQWARRYIHVVGLVLYTDLCV